MVFKALSVHDTAKIAKDLAESLVGGEVILLNGALGAGKTTFAKSLAGALGVKDTVTSPTFTFMKSYEGRLPSRPDEPITLFHYDLYRADDETEVTELGLAENLGTGICAIEWNKFTDIKAKVIITVNIKNVDGDTREIEVI